MTSQSQHRLYRWLAVTFVMWQREVGGYLVPFSNARGGMIKPSVGNLFNNGVSFLAGILVPYWGALGAASSVAISAIMGEEGVFGLIRGHLKQVQTSC